MARKSLVVLTSAVGVAAVAIGAYVARHRRDGYTANMVSEAGEEWGTDDDLAQELADVVAEEPVRP